MFKKYKKLLLVTSSLTAISMPTIMVVACNKNDEDNVKKIDLDTNSKIKLLLGAKDFYKTFISATEPTNAMYDIHIASGQVDTHIKLTKDEVMKIRTASDIPNSIDDGIDIDSFAEIASNIFDVETIYVLGKRSKLVNIISEKSTAISKIIAKDFGGSLPTGITLIDILSKDSEKIVELKNVFGRTLEYKLVFKGKDKTGKDKTVNVIAKINLDRKQSVVDKHESEGGKIKQAIKTIKDKFHKFASTFKKFVIVTKDKITNWGNILVGFTQNIAGALIKSASSLFPPVAIITKIPVIGAKIMSTLNDKIVFPLISKLLKPFADSLNK